jgi:TonB family protein
MVAVKTVRRLLPVIAALLAAGCATPTPVAPGNYYVDVEFTVAPDGRTTDAKVIKTNAPKEFQQEALQEVRRYKAEPSADPSRGRRRIEYSVEAEQPVKKP